MLLKDQGEKGSGFGLGNMEFWRIIWKLLDFFFPKLILFCFLEGWELTRKIRYYQLRLPYKIP